MRGCKPLTRLESTLMPTYAVAGRSGLSFRDGLRVFGDMRKSKKEVVEIEN